MGKSTIIHYKSPRSIVFSSFTRGHWWVFRVLIQVDVENYPGLPRENGGEMSLCPDDGRHRSTVLWKFLCKPWFLISRWCVCSFMPYLIFVGFSMLFIHILHVFSCLKICQPCFPVSPFLLWNQLWFEPWWAMSHGQDPGHEASSTVILCRGPSKSDRSVVAPTVKLKVGTLQGCVKCGQGWLMIEIWLKS